MYSLVPDQVGYLRECLLAPRVLTAIRLRLVVHTGVLLQRRVLRERLVALRAVIEKNSVISAKYWETQLTTWRAGYCCVCAHAPWGPSCNWRAFGNSRWGIWRTFYLFKFIIRLSCAGKISILTNIASMGHKKYTRSSSPNNQWIKRLYSNTWT